MDALEDVEDAMDPGVIDQVFEVADVVDARVTGERGEIVNPMDVLLAVEFKKRFRFHKETVQNYILPLIIDDMEPQDMRGDPFPPLIQLLTALRFYATGSFQIVCSDLLGISQPSVSRIVCTMSTVLARLRGRFITFPTTPLDMAELKGRFEEVGRIRNRPGLNHIIGAIDGCHIPIQRPQADDGVDPEAYRNRKNYFSIRSAVS